MALFSRAVSTSSPALIRAFAVVWVARVAGLFFLLRRAYRWHRSRS
ncbi:hypothetical protein [Streptomyces sp. RerS4]|nr:hypothetical protein [Streptomyces sp. RerS4]UQX01890.1 hypothetical protein M4D82_16280 [Streptomyces sp. RerS4]